MVARFSTRNQNFPQDSLTAASLVDVVLVGDSLELARRLPPDFVKCMITSPPYFGHREYSENGHLRELELGRENEPQVYVQRMVALFDELRRVLHPAGTLWLNLGDTYRDGQLVGIPWRVALGLQDAGWLLRSEIIWHKPNAMPSSVKNRPTTAHEHLFLLAKSSDYFYNADAIREPHVTFTAESKMKGGRNHFGKREGTPERGKNKGNPNLHNSRWDQAFHPLGRNKRTVWNIPLGKFRGTHFAVFPEPLVECCILAGTSAGDLVLDPFMGSGTTAIVARRLERHFLGLELIPEYAEMTFKRVKEVTVERRLFTL
ncbi:MAG: site-specific DNA-methyltransferase [Pyrinomonadaceae bacterium]|nr:site-specific DNA-methyltransferase [Pyrinomonadaceae bacterium]